MRRRARTSFVQTSPVETGALSARLPGEADPSSRVTVVRNVGVVHIEDVARSRGRLRKFGGARSSFAFPRMQSLRRVDGRSHPQYLRARQIRRGCVRPFAEREHIETFVSSTQRVRLVRDPVHDAIACAHLIRLPVLPRQTGEHEEDLLLVELDVRGRRPPVRLDLDACDADVLGARCFAKVEPRAAEMTLFEPLAFDVVPVGDQRSSSPSQ